MLLDGATGTELMKMRLNPGECSEVWNMSKPEKVQELARAYFNAGSDAVLTHSFGASPLRLARYKLENLAYDINRASAKNAQAVCPNGKFVLGCLGPTEEFIIPYGNLSMGEAIDSYASQVIGLRGGVDGFSLETFSDLVQMECAVKAIQENSDLPYLCSMTFKKTPRGYFTEMGVSVPKAVESLVGLGAFAIGTNCGNGFRNIIEIAEEIRGISSDVKIICEPNAGKPRVVDGKDEYLETPELFADYLSQLMKYNPSIVGGCCGTNPKHIRRMREFLDKI